MAMPVLDPARHQRAYLVNPAHTLPVPGRKMFFPADGLVIDVEDPYWRLPLCDGSLTLRAPEASTEEPAGAPEAHGAAQDVVFAAQPDAAEDEGAGRTR